MNWHGIRPPPVPGRTGDRSGRPAFDKGGFQSTSRSDGSECVSIHAPPGRTVPTFQSSPSCARKKRVFQSPRTARHAPAGPAAFQSTVAHHPHEGSRFNPRRRRGHDATACPSGQARMPLFQPTSARSGPSEPAPARDGQTGRACRFQSTPAWGDPHQGGPHGGEGRRVPEPTGPIRPCFNPRSGTGPSPRPAPRGPVGPVMADRPPLSSGEPA